MRPTFTFSIFADNKYLVRKSIYVFVWAMILISFMLVCRHSNRIHVTYYLKIPSVPSFSCLRQHIKYLSFLCKGKIYEWTTRCIIYCWLRVWNQYPVEWQYQMFISQIVIWVLDQLFLTQQCFMKIFIRRLPIITDLNP